MTFPMFLAKPMKKHLLFIALSFLCATHLFAAPEKPNILFIMSDDHAAHAIGAYGGRLAKLNPTPNIDRLAREGIRLTNCFCTNSICVPSRATILTGQYSHVNGITTLKGQLPADRQTLALEMKRADYQTAVIGKWHLKAEPAAFDFYTVLPGQGSYFNPIFRAHPAASTILPGNLVRETYNAKAPWPDHIIRAAGYDNVHADDAITNLSLAWLKHHRQTKPDKPFFLMHHFKGPHDNFENAERYDFLFENENIPEPESLRNRGNHGPVEAPQYGTSVSQRNTRRNMGHHMFVDRSLSNADYTTVSYQRYLKKFLRTVRGVDDNIGRLLAHLDKTDQLANTIVVYTADQGFMLGEHDYIDKRWMYDESMRMPFLIRYPARLKPGTCDDLINNTDFAATLLELAGVSESEQPKSFQGRSFLPNLLGKTPADWRSATYYRYWMHMAHHDNPAHFGIRTKTHKLIFFYGRRLNPDWYWNPNRAKPTVPHWELYDLVNDPKEMNNLYGQPEVAELTGNLKKQLFEVRDRIKDTDTQYPEVAEALETAK